MTAPHYIPFSFIHVASFELQNCCLPFLKGYMRLFIQNFGGKLGEGGTQSSLEACPELIG